MRIQIGGNRSVIAPLKSINIGYHLATSTTLTNLMGGGLIAISCIPGETGLDPEILALFKKSGFALVGTGSLLGAATRIKTAIKDKQPNWALASMIRGFISAPIIAASGESLVMRTLANWIPSPFFAAGYATQTENKTSPNGKKREHDFRFIFSPRTIHSLYSGEQKSELKKKFSALIEYMIDDLKELTRCLNKERLKQKSSADYFRIGAWTNAASALTYVLCGLTGEMALAPVGAMLGLFSNSGIILNRIKIASHTEGYKGQLMKYVGIPLSSIGFLTDFTNLGFALGCIGLALSENLTLILWNSPQKPVTEPKKSGVGSQPNPNKSI